MTFLEKTKKECTGYLENGNLKNCLNQLKIALKQDSAVRHDLTLILGRYNVLLRQEFLIDPSEFRRETAKIGKSVLQLLEDLEDADVSEGIFVESILVICNQDKRSEMESFFGKKYFPNAEFINYGEPLPKGIFDVIVLEDERNIISQMEAIGQERSTLTELNKARRAEMTQYLEASDTFFLYYGARFDIPGYENRVYFTNSRFSIYARLKELLEYAKYYDS